MFSALFRRVALAAILVLVGLMLVVLLRPTVTAWMADVTGEEDPVAQVKGVVNLVEIWLTERPLQLAPDLPLPHTSLRPYGVSVFLEQEADDAAVVRSLDMIRAAGIGIIRQQFPWEDIEIHAKGDFEDRRHSPARSAWAKYDRIIQLAEERGLTVVARLDAPPDWTRADRAADDTFGPPDRFDDYGDFVAAVVSRYRGRLRYYQIWNEPNIYPEWGIGPPDPEAYTDLLRIAAERARAIDPNVVIISAPLAPTLQTGERGMYDLLYLERMLAAGAARHFDILGIIAYGLGSGPNDHRAVWHRTNFARPLLLRDLMVRTGHADKPAWIMEMGWSAVPAGMPAPFGRVTEEQQARYTVDAYRRIENDYPWVGAACLWFFRRPSDEWFQRPEGYFRLVNPDWTTMPAYHALAAAATAPPVLPRGAHSLDHPAVAATAGSPDELRFRFEGTGLALHLAANAAASTFAVTIDGVTREHTLAGAPDGWRAVASGLDPGVHAASIRRVAGAASIDGLRVERSGDGHLQRLSLVLAALGAVIGIGAATRGISIVNKRVQHA